MADETELDFTLLPSELQPMASLIARYGEGDDVERESRLKQAPTEDLSAMVEGTAPHWDLINAFLDENLEQVGPRQDMALALDGFAQAAMDAQGELEAR